MAERSAIRWLLTWLAIAVIGAPLAFIATFLLTPVWSWYERTTAIESVGHSGPASRCFIVVYAVLVAAFCTGEHALYRRAIKQRTANHG